MDQAILHHSSARVRANDRSFEAWQPHNDEPPKFEVISLDCEITAYAPDEGNAPLF